MPAISIWLVPSAATIQKLETIMHAHPVPKPGSKSYPHFPPHITIASAPPSTALTAIEASIPPSLRMPIRVHFQTIEIGDHYFRSIYITIRPSKDLSDLRSSIHAALCVEPTTPKFPHMSVYYIHDTDAEERTRILEELRRTGLVRQDHDSVKLDCSTVVGTPEWIEGFEGSEIWIVNCDGPVEGWDALKKIQLPSTEVGDQ